MGLGSSGTMSKTTYKIVLHQAALSEIKKLPKKIKTRVKDVISSLSREPFPLTAQRLKGRKNAFRIRVAEYRLLYEVHATEIVVYVIGVAHRKEVYQRLLRRK